MNLYSIKKTIVYSLYTSFLILQSSKFSTQIILLHPTYLLFLSKGKACAGGKLDSKRNNTDNLRKNATV